MTIKRRLMIAAAIFAFASVLYGVAKYYSPLLILHVVEQSLVQKAPAGISSTQMRERLHAYLSATPDKKSQMQKLFRISEYLEKAQYITLEELNEHMPVEKPIVLQAQ
jgi:hypothetical protein